MSVVDHILSEKGIISHAVHYSKFRFRGREIHLFGENHSQTLPCSSFQEGAEGAPTVMSLCERIHTELRDEVTFFIEDSDWFSYSERTDPESLPTGKHMTDNSIRLHRLGAKVERFDIRDILFLYFSRRRVGGDISFFSKAVLQEVSAAAPKSVLQRELVADDRGRQTRRSRLPSTLQALVVEFASVIENFFRDIRPPALDPGLVSYVGEMAKALRDSRSDPPDELVQNLFNMFSDLIDAHVVNRFLASSDKVLVYHAGYSHCENVVYLLNALGAEQVTHLTTNQLLRSLPHYAALYRAIGREAFLEVPRDLGALEKGTKDHWQKVFEEQLQVLLRTHQSEFWSCLPLTVRHPMVVSIVRAIANCQDFRLGLLTSSDSHSWAHLNEQLL